MEESRRKSDHVTYDHVFLVDGQEELCRHTGFEVFYLGVWWYEFEDSNGDLHLGN